MSHGLPARPILWWNISDQGAANPTRGRSPKGPLNERPVRCAQQGLRTPWTRGCGPEELIGEAKLPPGGQLHSVP